VSIVQLTKMLVVEDEPLIRMGLADTCESAGFVVAEAADGVEALAIIQANQDLRLVLTDVDMPRMNGIELSRTIASQFPGVQVVLMSGMTLSRTADFPTHIPFFEKPVNESALVDCLKRLSGNEG
jgi:YesN/AraC family two-component response regulator